MMRTWNPNRRGFKKAGHYYLYSKEEVDTFALQRTQGEAHTQLQAKIQERNQKSEEARENAKKEAIAKVIALDYNHEIMDQGLKMCQDLDNSDNVALDTAAILKHLETLQRKHKTKVEKLTLEVPTNDLAQMPSLYPELIPLFAKEKKETHQDENWIRKGILGQALQNHNIVFPREVEYPKEIIPLYRAYCLPYILQERNMMWFSPTNFETSLDESQRLKILNYRKSRILGQLKKKNSIVYDKEWILARLPDVEPETVANLNTEFDAKIEAHNLQVRREALTKDYQRVGVKYQISPALTNVWNKFVEKRIEKVLPPDEEAFQKFVKDDAAWFDYLDRLHTRDFQNRQNLLAIEYESNFKVLYPQATTSLKNRFNAYSQAMVRQLISPPNFTQFEDLIKDEQVWKEYQQHLYDLEFKHRQDVMSRVYQNFVIQNLPYITPNLQTLWNSYSDAMVRQLISPDMDHFKQLVQDEPEWKEYQEILHARQFASRQELVKREYFKFFNDKLYNLPATIIPFWNSFTDAMIRQLISPGNDTISTFDNTVFENVDYQAYKISQLKLKYDEELNSKYPQISPSLLEKWNNWTNSRLKEFIPVNVQEFENMMENDVEWKAYKDLLRESYFEQERNVIRRQYDEAFAKIYPDLFPSLIPLWNDYVDAMVRQLLPPGVITFRQVVHGEPDWKVYQTPRLQREYEILWTQNFVDMPENVKEKWDAFVLQQIEDLIVSSDTTSFEEFVKDDKDWITYQTARLRHQWDLFFVNNFATMDPEIKETFDPLLDDLAGKLIAPNREKFEDLVKDDENWKKYKAVEIQRACGRLVGNYPEMTPVLRQLWDAYAKNCVEKLIVPSTKAFEKSVSKEVAWMDYQNAQKIAKLAMSDIEIINRWIRDGNVAELIKITSNNFCCSCRWRCGQGCTPMRFYQQHSRAIGHHRLVVKG